MVLIKEVMSSKLITSHTTAGYGLTQITIVLDHGQKKGMIIMCGQGRSSSGKESNTSPLNPSLVGIKFLWKSMH